MKSRLTSGQRVRASRSISAVIRSTSPAEMLSSKSTLISAVIWSGDEDEGFLSSHRLVTTGTHTGHGLFGPPTGRSFTVRVIADCAAKDDVIYDEWLIRDYSGIANQLGFETVEFTRDLIAREGGPEKAKRPFTLKEDVRGPYTARGNDNEWGQRLADILQPDIAWAGGVTGLLKICHMAEAAGIPVIPHAGLNMPYGQHFCFAMPNVPWGEFLPQAAPGVALEDSITIPGMAVPKDGLLVPSDAPGFGIDVTLDWINRQRI